jgi:poly(hydroxyalkanoate) granule-associated protein
MLKKAKAELGAKSSAEAQGLSKSVLASSHQIWLAGLGAFSKAQEGSAKVFETLVKQGEVLEARTRKAAAQTADAACGAAMSKAKEMQAIAGGTWDKLEQVFEDRVSKALGKLGVHTSADVERLSQRVNELSEAVNALLKAQGGRPKPQPSPAARKMAAARGTSAAKADSPSGATPKRAGKTAAKRAKGALE